MSTTEAKTGTTLQDVETMRERRDALEKRRDEYAEKKDALSSKLARMIADDQDGTDEAERLRDERDAARQEVHDLESALEVMADRISEATEEAARSEASVEIANLKRKVGGIAGQHEADVERAHELADKLVETIRRVETARNRQRHLVSMAEALADRFEVELGEFKVLPEGADNLSALRKRTARRLEDGGAGGPEAADGVESLQPGQKVAHAARALGETDARAAELLELVGEDVEANVATVQRAVKRQAKADMERKALGAAKDYLDSAVKRPIHASQLYSAFKDKRLPPSKQSDDKLFREAVEELGLVRVKDESGLHHYAPPAMKPDGRRWRAASVGE